MHICLHGASSTEHINVCKLKPTNEQADTDRWAVLHEKRGGGSGRTLTVEVHVPGVVPVLVLPDGLTDGAYQRDGQQAAEQDQDLKISDALHVGQFQGRSGGILGRKKKNIYIYTGT